MIARALRMPTHDARHLRQATPRPTMRRFAVASDANRVSCRNAGLPTLGARSATLATHTTYPPDELFGIIIRN